MAKGKATKSAAKGPSKAPARGRPKPEPKPSPTVAKAPAFAKAKQVAAKKPDAPKAVEKRERKHPSPSPRAIRPTVAPDETASPERPRTTLGMNGETIELVDPEKPLPKTKLSAKQLQHYKELLIAKRRELLGDVSQLSSEALRNNRQDASGDLSNMPSHMADIGSDNWEQEFTLGLIATERALLREIDDALERIEDRTYGICLATHRPIRPERLEAKPWARYCIEYARLVEAGRAP